MDAWGIIQPQDSVNQDGNGLAIRRREGSCGSSGCARCYRLTEAHFFPVVTEFLSAVEADNICSVPVRS